MLLSQPFGATSPIRQPQNYINHSRCWTSHASPQTLRKTFFPSFHAPISPLTCRQTSLLHVASPGAKCGGSPASVHTTGVSFIPYHILPTTGTGLDSGISGLSESVVGLIYFILGLNLIRLVLIYFLALKLICAWLYPPGMMRTTILTGSKCPTLSFSSPSALTRYGFESLKLRINVTLPQIFSFLLRGQNRPRIVEKFSPSVGVVTTLLSFARRGS